MKATVSLNPKECLTDISCMDLTNGDYAKIIAGDVYADSIGTIVRKEPTCCRALHTPTITFSEKAIRAQKLNPGDEITIVIAKD